MTNQLRLTQPGELPAPRTDTDSATVLADAVEALARLRTPYCGSSPRTAPNQL